MYLPCGASFDNECKCVQMNTFSSLSVFYNVNIKNNQDKFLLWEQGVPSSNLGTPTQTLTEM